MKFATKIPLSISENSLDYTSRIISIGSCFAVNMSEQLSFFKFQNTCNPFGILFHTLAIENLIDFAVSKKQFTDQDVFFHNERWHCPDVHSDLSNANKEELINDLNTIISSLYEQISISTHIIITYGTSWVYRNSARNAIVANCHKVPQKEFSKEILSVETIVSSINHTIELIQKVNSNVNFIFTVSPVRHLKDGFVENQVSKSHLLSALYQLQVKPNIEYFPSYEIMMDELRDYRFYAEDMIHPSQVAINYIWERFVESHVSQESYPIMEEIASIQKGLEHRPFNPNSDAHQKFVKNLDAKIESVKCRFPFLIF